jgi:hypothetical protein
MSQKRMPKLCSNHFSILLDCGGIQSGGRYFKFKNMWLKAEGFVGRVKRWWSSYHFQGSQSIVLAHKLKPLKDDLKVWNEQVFCNVENQKKNLLEELNVLDGSEEERRLCDEEKPRKDIVSGELDRATLLEEKVECTEFFHQVVNSNRGNNSIESLLVNGSVSSDQFEIREHIVLSYNRLSLE